MSTNDRPFEKILIVGAGPAGLLLAILLAQHSIPSVVLEAWPHLDSRLRATQYGVPATRVFRKAGLIDVIRAASITSFGSICWRRVEDGQKLVTLDMSSVADHPDRMTIIPLGELTAIMMDQIRAKYSHLVELRFRHRVVGTGQDDDQAWADVEVEDEDGSNKTAIRIIADYLVGCDGGKSAVRKSLFGHAWPGVTFDDQVVVQNVWYDGFEQHGWSGGNYMVDRETWGLIARRGKGGLWRVTYGDGGHYSEQQLLDRRDARLQRMLPGSPSPDQYRVGSTNIYKMHNRCVAAMRVGRVLLAGDAAHICNPWGGYGCMSAVLDAGGLADCLVGLHQGLVDDSILDTYARVRRDKWARFVDVRSTRNLERISKADPWTVMETDKFMGILKELEGDPVKTKAFLLKFSSIEYDFTQHYTSASNGEEVPVDDKDGM